MRIKAIIILVIVYILAAFAWLTFSLLNYTNSDFNLKKQVIQAGLNACVLQVMEQAKNGKLGEDTTVNHFIKQLEIEIDESQLTEFVKNKYKDSYLVEYKDFTGKRVVQIVINQDKIQMFEDERKKQLNFWLYESILLLVLVGLGIYGVFYTINSFYKLNKRQNNFLLSVTHEFKTPIAAIRLMLQTSKNPKVKAEKKEELIENSIDNTFRLEELAENMLTAMQIENDRYTYNQTNVDLSNMLKFITNNQSVKGEMTATIQEEVFMLGDEFILKMVFNNLVENAYKYSDNGPVSVTLAEDDSGIRIEVKDQGIGIQKRDMKNIFKKFYRIQDDATRTTKGTGLGLFIVKQAVERHNGKISVKPNEPKGSVFIVTFS